jgi:uncharacterized membrane protein YjjP (DUF1212 family)
MARAAASRDTHQAVRRLPPGEFADYLLEIGGTLVAYGCPSYRLEEVIRVVAEQEGYAAQAFAMPTGLFLSIRGASLAEPVARMIRVKEWGTNLERLTEVDAIFNDVAERRSTIEEARQRLEALQRRPPAYPRALYWPAMAMLSGAAAIFFRGSLKDVVAAAAAGSVVGLLVSALSRDRSARFLVEFVGGFSSALCAWAATRVRPDLSREVIVLSGVIALVPGMTLTTGLAELAQKNLVSGGARLMEALTTFLSILFGVALAVGIEQLLGVDAGHGPSRAALGLPYQAAALACSSLALAVIFSVPRALLWTAACSGALGYVATALGARHLPGHVAAFAAALAISLFANALARKTERPAQLFQLPGMMLLVPGSFGFLSLEDFLRGDLLHGAQKGFEMLLIAGALVTGILLANLLLPARKIL